MKIAMGADHGGYDLKEHLKKTASLLGHEVVDMGCYSADAVDYPEYVEPVCTAVASKECVFGVLICGTGMGMSMAANRNQSIRAAVCTNEYTARLSREHNDANVLCLGARVLGFGIAEEIFKVWLAATFDGGRHLQRIRKFST